MNHDARTPAGAQDTRQGQDKAAGEHRKQIELTPIHDFAGKLMQPEILSGVKEYVRWQVEQRSRFDAGEASTGNERVPDRAPVSINLDLTTACNFACDHCVDKNILNKPFRYEHDRLLASLEGMAKHGLRSVIVIGGGEPTTYKHFVETIRFMKDLGLQVSIVSNGSGMDRIAEVADRFDGGDWVRLSLDSGTDATFQAMHRPRIQITLEQICEAVPGIKEINPAFPMGFSFIITWKGATIHDQNIVENVHEIATAAELACRNRFDYIALKPFLTRARANNAEIVDLKDTDGHFEEVMARIRVEVDRARKFATPGFRVYETTNLKVLENRSYRDYTHQPRHCHMQFFRQVLSPLGLYNCPVYRNQPHGKLGAKDAYADEASFEATRAAVAALIRDFDATEQCQEVTCLYNHVNWWLEDLIRHPEKLDPLEARSQVPEDFFL